jgi:hypothetical protein
MHVKYKSHSLQYAGRKWHYHNGQEIYQKSDITSTYTQPSKHVGTRVDKTLVALSLSDEIALTTPTRSIFSWLRPERYPHSKQEIAKHEDSVSGSRILNKVEARITTLNQNES